MSGLFSSGRAIVSPSTVSVTVKYWYKLTKITKLNFLPLSLCTGLYVGWVCSLVSPHTFLGRASPSHQNQDLPLEMAEFSEVLDRHIPLGLILPITLE